MLFLFLIIGIIIGIIVGRHIDFTKTPYIGGMFHTKNELELKKKCRNYELQVKDLKSKINSENSKNSKENAEKIIQRVQFMKRIAFSDEQLSVYEKDIITTYILSQDIKSDLKVQLLKSYSEEDTYFKKLLNFFSEPNPREMFNDKEEAESFILILEELAKSDGDYCMPEASLIDSIRSEYNIPINQNH